MQTHRIQAAQQQLIAALDAGDAPDILTATGTLSSLIDELRATPALYASTDLREEFEHIEKLSVAAAYRLRVLTDHTRQRLELLGADTQPISYGPRAA
ncbi:MAG: hypothetical protein OSA47_03050 [Novosphingopyxis baekryungensis]|jgi:hypothetical protein|uniref:hypothetical protein n=1 Tax=Novosphingopyxis baekryungensis TaxID=279369 RepID=UPI0003B3A555|nr:hypothetical protein [Novosphingopyxis baekryungensis]MDE0932565.1 hypothetical protein [Novosphingopyxis baekryungensis]